MIPSSPKLLVANSACKDAKGPKHPRDDLRLVHAVGCAHVRPGNALLPGRARPGAQGPGGTSGDETPGYQHRRCLDLTKNCLAKL